MARIKSWNQRGVVAMARAALRDAAEDEMLIVGNSAQELAPRRTGAMRNTARLDVRNDHVSVKYGGNTARYAAIQHWPWRYGRPDYRRWRYTTPNTGPRYLERPFLSKIGDPVSGRVNKTTFKRMESKVRAALRKS